MTLLASFDHTMSALAAALKSNDVRVLKASRDELEHIKLHAKQIRDRVMLAKATEYQMRLERQLGVTMPMLKAAGLLHDGGRRAIVADGEIPPATLAEIGVDKKLSMKAQRAAALDDQEFESVIAEMRLRMASNKAIMVDPIQSHEKATDLAGRRAAHAARAITGGCIADLGKLALSGKRFKSIGMDPQWKFLTRSAEGDGRSANVHYKTEEVDKIKQLPVGELADEDALLYMWMVDWCPQDALDLMAHYGFRHITTAFTWVKTNGEDAALDVWSPSTWHMGQGYWTRANPEACWLASKGAPPRLYADVRQLIIAPVMEHSRKPDEWLDRVERLGDGDYLELQARRTRKNWFSWGDELEFTGVAA
jgi:N6-adenosine-specific RNA methylase IME4